MGDNSSSRVAPHAPSKDTAAPDSKSGDGKVQQPKPQALPSRAAPSAILVSPRQKGNSILNYVRALPWEWADTPADYVLGLTTCALFLSLKYHRLHPEYIYSRIHGLQGKYQLRIVLTIVDIDNHEESLRELSKTSMVNNVTIILCWSAQEAGRYLELFKSYENAAPTNIKAQQATTYSDQSMDFITTPRSINKTDALGLISTFGSLRTSVSARPEEVALVDGWGEKKVQRWCNTVREPFRVKSAKRDLPGDEDGPAVPKRRKVDPNKDIAVAARLGIASAAQSGATQPTSGLTHSSTGLTHSSKAPLNSGRHGEPDEDEQLAMLEAETAPHNRPGTKDPELSEGIAKAIAKYRSGG